MWSYQNSTDTAATPDAVFALWADVLNWPVWIADIEAIELDGPFATGSVITMTPAGQEPVRLEIAEVVADRQFADIARFGTVELRTMHLVEPSAGGGSRVTYRMEMTGEGADELGAQVGPAITGDWPETMAALVELAEKAAN
ncbi:SRPBCC family protein [Kitasatospora sp. RB6PN24]|uniref:SRPBCC family protein n=1 Tax=Kitasatospora humi TaxID=2893891 RepID=UPI001E29D366|nr:SRPBCC family protein [Kitasatospora humi]MCC9311321.1 SRPBCC family protein [Kitasatospora humi]